MATVKLAPAVALGALAFGALGCEKLEGFGGPTPPLVTFQLEATGDLGPLRPPGETGAPRLMAALVWGEQWLPEPLCILPPENSAAATTIAAGCRDPFSFVPARVEANVPIELGVPTTLELDTVPADDVLVGDVTARVAYGSIVIYDDRNASGTLELARPDRLGNANGMRGPSPDTNPVVLPDDVYGASFLTMTAPDQRVAYREGDFDTTAAFYPRAGCGAPLPGFSVVAAGGFSSSAAITATLAGQLPAENPASCAESPASDVVITVPVQAPAGVDEVACNEPTDDSSVRYREPPADEPDFTDRTNACVHLPTFGGPPSSVIELVVSSPSNESCRGLTHYVLRGCPSDPSCAMPDWDHTAVPPPWWPCPASRTARALAIAWAAAGSVASSVARADDAAPPASTAPASAPAPLASPASKADDDGAPRVSLPTEEDRVAWQKSGFRLGLGLVYGRMIGLRGAPSGRLLGAELHIGLRLDRDWSIVTSFQYASASARGGLSGLRYAGTIDPTWHVTPSLALAVGFGFGGIVEPGNTGRPEVTPLPSTLDTTYTFPDSRTPLPSCTGVGAAGLARAEYAWVLGPRASTSLSLEAIGQYTACVDPTGRVEPDTAQAIVRRQLWAHTGITLTWGVSWR